MNFSAVMEWVKANVFTIVFLVVILAAFISMPLVAGSMNEGVRSKVQDRASKLNQLSQLENTQIQMPGAEESRRGVVTEHVLTEYRSRVGLAREDANAVYERAVELNRKQYRVLDEELFPAPEHYRKQLLAHHFHEKLMQAYDELLRELNVGSPPSPADVRHELDVRELQFRNQILARDAREELPEEEEKQLREQLVDLRLLQYQECAERLSMYLSRDVLRLPEWDQQNIPTLAQLFEWQWKFWIHSDVLHALKQANGDRGTLVRSPVKHVLRFTFDDGPTAVSEGTGGGSGRGGGASSGGGGGASMGGGGGIMGGGGLVGGGGSGRGRGGRGGADFGQMEDDDGPPPGPVTVNRQQQVQPDYSESFTGRKSNDVYDVRHVTLDLVVETERMPELLDALAEHNFMTVVWLQFEPADHHEAARDGFYYGSAPVTRLSIQLETVWLREWTASYMPATTRRALGIASTPAEPQM